MNTKLVESLAEIIQSLTAEEKDLLNRKINLTTEIQHRPVYEVANPGRKSSGFSKVG